MARATDDDILEPILPKQPPIAGEPGPPETSDGLDPRPGGRSAGAPWHRTVLVACAVVATLALVFSAVQLSSIAEDQRLQACQARAFAEETIVGDGGSGRQARSNLQERFADCLGIEIESEEDGAGRAGDD